MAKKNILLRSKKKKAQALLEANRLDEAHSLFTQLAKSAPMDVDIWLGFGVVEGRRGNHAAATECLRKAAAIEPNHARIQYNLGVALRDSGDIEAAIPSFQCVARRNPKYADAFDCLADCYMKVGKFDEAIDTFQQALALTPGKAETHSNLGSVFQAKGWLSEAEACYRKAISLKPAIQIADNLGAVLCSQGRFTEAIDIYRKGLVRQPGNAKLLSNLLLTLNYLPDRDQVAVLEEHRKCNELFSGAKVFDTFANKPEPERRLKVAYVSADFRDHSVAYFVEPILEGHNRAAIEVYGYSAVTRPDTVTRRLESVCDHWVDISAMTPDQVAARVREDRIDILVDLAGHTAHNRLTVFARRPAPVQVTYLGYPNTSGMEAIHYRIVDQVVDPADQNRYYAEELVRLPGCFLCYQPPEDAPSVCSLPAGEGGELTFGSFNNLSKVNDEVIHLWSEVVKAVPGSRLLVKNPSLTDEKTRMRYQQKFFKEGLSEQRVELIGHTATRQEHLALYGCVDIALDTFPYNGTTTTCEALWMGVPVMTLSGSTHAGRVGKSLLGCVGLDGWIADRQEDFVTAVTALAADRGKLVQLRAGLRDRLAASPLCDREAFAHNIEHAYRTMWYQWCESDESTISVDDAP